MVRHGWPAECDPLGDVANVQLGSSEDLDEILAHRIGERDQQVAAERQVIAKRPHLWVEGARIDQAAHVGLIQNGNPLKHIDILGD